MKFQFYLLFTAVSAYSQCTTIYSMGGTNGATTTINGKTITYNEGGVNGGSVGPNSGNQLASSGFTNISTDNTQTIDANSGAWRQYIYQKLTFSSPLVVGNAFKFVDIDGAASNYEIAAIVGRNSSGTQVNPTLTCGSNTTLVTYNTVNDPGVTLGNVPTCRGNQGGNLDPTDATGHGTADFGTSPITELYFFYGLEPTATVVASQVSGISSLCFETSLPVKLSNFKGLPMGSQIELSWHATEMVNFDRFEVQKSTDAIDFETIGIVQGSTETAYHFTDKIPTDGVNYYRLKMVDLDGSTEYSKIIVVFYEENAEYVEIQNPSSAHNIQLFTNLTSPKISLMNSNGQSLEISTAKNEKGYHVVPRQPLTGLYFVRVESPTRAFSRRVLIL